MLLGIVIAFFAIAIGIDAIVMMKRKRQAAAISAASLYQGFFDEKTANMPRGLKYDSGHTWAHMDEYGRIRIGVDDFLQHIMGPISGIIMKNPGDFVKKGEVFMSLIQDGKRLELRSPVNGKVRVANEKLNVDASVINVSPYDQGWVYLIEADDFKRDSRLMYHTDSAARWINSEFLRMKDFFSSLPTTSLQGTPAIVMQDGGSLKDQILHEFGPEIWEEFQNGFLDKKNEQHHA